MNKVMRFVSHSWSEKMALLWISNIIAGIHIALGVAILAGGKDRFSYPTYQPLIDLTLGETWIWGAWICGAAVVMMIPARWPQIIGLWLGMVWNVFWCTLFAVAVVEYPTAGATATVAYGGFALIDAALLTARIIDRDED